MNHRKDQTHVAFLGNTANTMENEEAVREIRELYDRLIAENDMRGAWRQGPMAAERHPETKQIIDFEFDGSKQLFFLIPRICFVDNACVFDEYSNSNKFNCTFVAMLQYIMYVLQICAVKFDATGMPPESYPLRVYLVPLPGVDGKTVDYLLVIDILNVEDEPYDISDLFMRLAKSKAKVINRNGDFIDENNAKPKKPLRHADEDPNDKRNNKYSIFRDVVKTVRDYDKVVSIIAQHDQCTNSEQLDPVNNFTVEAAMRWAVDKRIHPVNQLNLRFCDHRMYKKRTLNGMMTTCIPKDLLRFAVPPDYWSPMLFSKQFMPHCIPEDYSMIFKTNLQKLFTDTIDTLRTEANPPAASRAVVVYTRPYNPEEDNEDLPTHDLHDTRDSMHRRKVPTYADCIDAVKGFGESYNASAETEPMNPVLSRIKTRLARIQHLIGEVHKTGSITDEEALAWHTDAKRCAISEYDKVKRDVSETSQKLYEYLEMHKLMNATPELLIFDPTKSAFDNYMGWFVDVLGVYCGVAVHQLTMWYLFVLIGTAFDPPGSQMHGLITGDGGSGKSYSVNALFSLLNRIGVYNSDSFSRGSEYIDRRVYDAIFYQDEVSLPSLVEHDSSQLAERKAILSQGFTMREALRIDETGRRLLDKLMCVKSGSWIGCMNKDQTSIINANGAEKTSMAALMSRYTLFDMSSIDHFLRTISYTKATMNNPTIDRDFKNIVGRILVFQRWRMEVAHLMYIGALAPVSLTVLSASMPKFEKILEDVKIKAANNRQGVNVERYCRQIVIMRALIERFCVRGVSPRFGEKYTTDMLLGLPTVATLDDVTHACTSLYHTYVPKHLTTVISVIREQVKAELLRDKLTTVVFCNPTSAPLRAAPSGAGAVSSANIDSGAQRLTQYVGFRSMTLGGFANKIWTNSQMLPEKPSELSVRNCIGILKNLLVETPVYTWQAGMQMPEASVFDNPTVCEAFVIAGHHVFVNLKLIVESNETRFEDLWRRAILAMCDSKTGTRSVLTGIPNSTHVWIPEEIKLCPRQNAVSVSLNPRFLPPSTRTVLTGCENGVIGTDAPRRAPVIRESADDEPEQEDQGTGDNVDVVDENGRAFVNYDVDMEFTAAYNWVMDMTNGLIAPTDAFSFAKDNQPITKRALLQSVLNEQKSNGAIAAKRVFIEYPSHVVSWLDGLKDLYDRASKGQLSQEELEQNGNSSFVVSVRDIMKSKMSDGMRATFDSEIDKLEADNSAIVANRLLTPAQYATMFSMEVADDDTLETLASRRFAKDYTSLYPTIQRKRIHENDDEEEARPHPARRPNIVPLRVDGENPLVHNDPPPRVHEDDGDDDDGDDDDEDDGRGVFRRSNRSSAPRIVEIE